MCIRDSRDLERGDILTLAFQGGEPTLAGLPFFQHFVQQVSRYESLGVRVSYACLLYTSTGATDIAEHLTHVQKTL